MRSNLFLSVFFCPTLSSAFDLMQDAIWTQLTFFFKRCLYSFKTFFFSSYMQNTFQERVLFLTPTKPAFPYYSFIWILAGGYRNILLILLCSTVNFFFVISRWSWCTQYLLLTLVAPYSLQFTGTCLWHSREHSIDPWINFPWDLAAWFQMLCSFWQIDYKWREEFILKLFTIMCCNDLHVHYQIHTWNRFHVYDA